MAPIKTQNLVSKIKGFKLSSNFKKKTIRANSKIMASPDTNFPPTYEDRYSADAIQILLVWIKEEGQN